MPLALYRGYVCTDFSLLLSFLSKKKEAKKSALFGQEISPVATCDLWLRPKNPQTFEKVCAKLLYFLIVFRHFKGCNKLKFVAAFILLLLYTIYVALKQQIPQCQKQFDISTVFSQNIN